MFIDASVVVAILNREDGFEKYVYRMEEHKKGFYFSPLARFEAVAAISRSRSGKDVKPTQEEFEAAGRVVDKFFASLEAKEITITSTVGDRALVVAGKFGKFVGHKADLNFGDCYSYACAQTYNIPLLYKGNDFSETDLA